MGFLCCETLESCMGLDLGWGQKSKMDDGRDNYGFGQKKKEMIMVFFV